MKQYESFLYYQEIVNIPFQQNVAIKNNKLVYYNENTASFIDNWLTIKIIGTDILTGLTKFEYIETQFGETRYFYKSIILSDIVKKIHESIKQEYHNLNNNFKILFTLTEYDIKHLLELKTIIINSFIDNIIIKQRLNGITIEHKLSEIITEDTTDDVITKQPITQINVLVDSYDIIMEQQNALQTNITSHNVITKQPTAQTNVIDAKSTQTCHICNNCCKWFEGCSYDECHQMVDSDYCKCCNVRLCSKYNEPNYFYCFGFYDGLIDGWIMWIIVYS